jgi:hypothetical protein
MAECNNVVIDLVSVTTDDDDSSSSSIDSFYDSFIIAFDQHGGAFVRNKVTMIVDTDDETTGRRTTALTFDGIDTDSSCCSSCSLSDDSWYCERAMRPSKQRRDVSARCASSSRIFLAAAAIVNRSRPRHRGS